MRIVYYVFPDHFGSNVVVVDKLQPDMEGEIGILLSEEDFKYDMYSADLELETGEVEVTKGGESVELTIADGFVTLVAPFRNATSAETWVKHIRNKWQELEDSYEQDEGDDAGDSE